jgi:hypothetical protein
MQMPQAKDHIRDATVTLYQKVLTDKYRPPSKGGNARAWHTHILTIKGERYSFQALGARQWVFVGDTVSFDWEWDSTRTYRNVAPESFQTQNNRGEVVVRGDRGRKRWRTADARLPARGSEWRD